MNNIPKKWLITIGVVLLFAFTNPSLSDFHDSHGKYAQPRKKANFLLFSIYEQGSEKYIGVVKNFIDITPSKQVAEKVIADSTRIADSTHASWMADSSAKAAAVTQIDPLLTLKQAK